VSEVLAAPGQPLDPATRARFEPHLGGDLGDVRVHTDARAAASADAVAAEAYTVGRQVVFASGRYDPGSPAGQTLLAHELAHVAQHAAAPSAAPTLARRPRSDSTSSSQHQSVVMYNDKEHRYFILIDGLVVGEVEVAPEAREGVSINVIIRQSVEGTFADVIVIHDGRARLRTFEPAIRVLRRSIVVLFKDIDTPQKLAQAETPFGPTIPAAPPSVQLNWLKGEYAKIVRDFKGKKLEDKLAAAGVTALRLYSLAESDVFAQVDPKLRAKIEKTAQQIERLLPKFAQAQKENWREEKKGRWATAGLVLGTAATVGGGPEDLPADALGAIAALGVLIFGIGVGTHMVMRDPDLPRRQAEALGDFLDTLTKPIERAEPVPVPLPEPHMGPEGDKDPESEKRVDPNKRVDPIPPKKPDDDRKEKETCAKVAPGKPRCQTNPAFCVTAPTRPAARMRAMEMLRRRPENLRSSITAGNEDAASDYCRGWGTHYNVHKDGKYYGAIIACDCCEDTDAGPVQQTKAAFVRTENRLDGKVKILECPDGTNQRR
jgi:hypothetical protein